MEVFVDLHRRMPAGEKLAPGPMVPRACEREIFLRTPALHLTRELMPKAHGWHPDLGTKPEP